MITENFLESCFLITCLMKVIKTISLPKIMFKNCKSNLKTRRFFKCFHKLTISLWPKSVVLLKLRLGNKHTQKTTSIFLPLKSHLYQGMKQQSYNNLKRILTMIFKFSTLI